MRQRWLHACSYVTTLSRSAFQHTLTHDGSSVIELCLKAKKPLETILNKLRFVKLFVKYRSEVQQKCHFAIFFLFEDYLAGKLRSDCVKETQQLIACNFASH